MLAAGANYKVTKNRLTRLALEGTKFEALKELFTGPTAVAVSADPVAAAKVCVAFATTNEKLIIVGGEVGETKLAAQANQSLDPPPSPDELHNGRASWREGGCQSMVNHGGAV